MRDARNSTNDTESSFPSLEMNVHYVQTKEGYPLGEGGKLLN